MLNPSVGTMDGDAKAPKKIKGAVKRETPATMAKAGAQTRPARLAGENAVGTVASKMETNAPSSAKRPKTFRPVDRAAVEAWEPHRAAHNDEYRATAIAIGAALPKGMTGQRNRQQGNDSRKRAKSYAQVLADKRAANALSLAAKAIDLGVLAEETVPLLFRRVQIKTEHESKSRWPTINSGKQSTTTNNNCPASTITTSDPSAPSTAASTAFDAPTSDAIASPIATTDDVANESGGGDTAHIFAITANTNQSGSSSSTTSSSTNSSVMPNHQPVAAAVNVPRGWRERFASWWWRGDAKTTTSSTTITTSAPATTSNSTAAGTSNPLADAASSNSIIAEEEDAASLEAEASSPRTIDLYGERIVFGVDPDGEWIYEVDGIPGRAIIAGQISTVLDELHVRGEFESIAFERKADGTPKWVSLAPILKRMCAKPDDPSMPGMIVYKRWNIINDPENMHDWQKAPEQIEATLPWYDALVLPTPPSPSSYSHVLVRK